MYSVILIYEICYCDKKTLILSQNLRRYSMYNVAFNKKRSMYNTAPSHYVDSVVSVMLDAVNNYDQPLTKEKLCAWQASFFPTGFSEGSQIEVGRYRTNEEHIVSGMFGRERVHYIAPSPERLEKEMAAFIEWFNKNDSSFGFRMSSSKSS